MVKRSSDSRVAHSEVEIQVLDLVRVGGIVAPFSFYRAPESRWAQETCAECPQQQYTTGEPSKVHGRDRVGIEEGSSGYRAQRVSIRGKSAGQRGNNYHNSHYVPYLTLTSGWATRGSELRLTTWRPPSSCIPGFSIKQIFPEYWPAGPIGTSYNTHTVPSLNLALLSRSVPMLGVPVISLPGPSTLLGSKNEFSPNAEPPRGQEATIPTTPTMSWTFKHIAVPLVLYPGFLDKTNFPRILNPRGANGATIPTTRTRTSTWNFTSKCDTRESELRLTTWRPLLSCIPGFSIKRIFPEYWPAGPSASCGYCCPLCPVGVQYSRKIRYIEPQMVDGPRRHVPGDPRSGTPRESQEKYRDGTV